MSLDPNQNKQGSGAFALSTLESLREAGFTIVETIRVIRCVEIHHQQRFCVVWPEKLKAQASDRFDSDYPDHGLKSRHRVVFQGVMDGTILDAQGALLFSVMRDEDLPALGIAFPKRRIWRGKDWYETVAGAEVDPEPHWLEALEAFRARTEKNKPMLKRHHSRNWKELLKVAWYRGWDADEEGGGHLRAIRNNLGPEWLDSYR